VYIFWLARVRFDFFTKTTDMYIHSSDISRIFISPDNIQKVNEDYNNGKIQPCVKVESETVNYNLLKFIKAVKQILDVDKTNE
jgi:hypothetical protein